MSAKTVKSVFMLTEGDYSSYHVIGVYSKRAIAKVVQEVIGGELEEVPIDPGFEELHSGLTHWDVLMLKNGTVESARPSERISTYQIGGSAEVWRRTKAPAYAGKGIPDALMATVWARDRKHAIKIVNEIRAEFIASGRWKV